MRITGLGIAPLFYAGAAAGSLIGSGLYTAEKSYESGFLNNLFQTLGLKDTPKLPSSSPASMAPPAPQTEHGMVYWSPEWQNEATQQRQVQYSADQKSWTSTSNDALQSKDGLWMTVALVAAAAVGVGLALKR